MNAEAVGAVEVKASDEKLFLSADEVMNAADRPTLEEYVPEWGGYVRLRSLSVSEREEWEKGTEADLEDFTFYSRFLILCMVDQNDKPLLSPKHHLEFFSRKSSAVVKRLFDLAQKHNGLGLTAKADAKKA